MAMIKTIDPFSEKDIIHINNHHVLFLDETKIYVTKKFDATDACLDELEYHYGMDLFHNRDDQFKFPPLPAVELVEEPVEDVKTKRGLLRACMEDPKKEVLKSKGDIYEELVVWDDKVPVFTATKIKCVDPPMYHDGFVFETKATIDKKTTPVRATPTTLWQRGVAALWQSYSVHHSGTLKAELRQGIDDTADRQHHEIIQFIAGDKPNIPAHTLSDGFNVFDKINMAQLLRLAADESISAALAKPRMAATASTMKVTIEINLGKTAIRNLGCSGAKRFEIRNLGVEIIMSCGVLVASLPGMSLGNSNIIIPFQGELYRFDPKTLELHLYTEKGSSSGHKLHIIHHGATDEGLLNYLSFDVTHQEPKAVAIKKRVQLASQKRQREVPLVEQLRAQKAKLKKAPDTKLDPAPERVFLNQVVYDRINHIYKMRMVYRDKMGNDREYDMPE